MSTGVTDTGRIGRGITGRTIFLMVTFGILAFVPLVLKLYQVQISEHSKYEGMAVDQQTRNTVISPERGTIYDRNMKALAISASVYNVCVNPNGIKTDAKRAEISRGLADILDLEAASIDERIRSNAGKQYLAVKLRVEEEEEKAVRQFILDSSLSGMIWLEPNTKRYYPYGNFASNILGFVSNDGQGVEGLELKYNQQLTGTPGRIITARDTQGISRSLQYEKYFDASNGMDMILTLDETIQHFLEKHLSAAVVENMVTKRAIGIVMDVKTGGILGMATSPSYDLNNRNEITDPAVQALLAGLEGEELSSARNAALLAQYRNKAVNDTYEPGSTFKIVTAAVALEEKVVTMADRFSCSGSIRVPGISDPVSCHRKIGHGGQSFIEGIQNSCNPVFVTVGLRIGRQKFWEYMQAFGFFEKTDVDMPGESSSIIAPYSAYNYSDVSLAVYSFGQTFNVTPIQMITAASAVANGGKLMWPHIAGEFRDKDGNAVETVQPRMVRQVISAETASKLCAALEEVVKDGTGRNAYVSGYRIAGKTGTSQKSQLPKDERYGHYVVSFLGFAPADDPQIALLVAMDEPMKGDANLRSGGQMAAPLAGRILADILPYIGLNAQYAPGSLEMMEIMTPNLKELPIADAERILSEMGVSYHIEGNGGTVIDQLPAQGLMVPLSAKMVLYTESRRPEGVVGVPDVTGKTPETANKLLVDAGLYMKISGVADNRSTTVKAGRQDIMPGEEVPIGTIINVEFIDVSVADDAL
ncbi:MAG: penicillin-binding transpeptidase domain-containing protein [Oscillospiraceae bacterium]|nr:penicillin-binding transpeptidase domain-containing protein [Oscillospiraceae bacterium]